MPVRASFQFLPRREPLFPQRVPARGVGTGRRLGGRSPNAAADAQAAPSVVENKLFFSLRRLAAADYSPTQSFLQPKLDLGSGRTTRSEVKFWLQKALRRAVVRRCEPPEREKKFVFYYARGRLRVRRCIWAPAA